MQQHKPKGRRTRGRYCDSWNEYVYSGVLFSYTTKWRRCRKKERKKDTIKASSKKLYISLPVTVISKFQRVIHSINTCYQILEDCEEKSYFLLTFRHRASSILGQAFRYSTENAHYIFNQQIYFISWYLLHRASLI